METGPHHILLRSDFLLLPPTALKSESGTKSWNENQLMVGLRDLKGLFQPKQLSDATGFMTESAEVAGAASAV